MGGYFIPITRPVPVFCDQGNSNSYPNPVKAGKTRQFEFGWADTHGYRFSCHA